MFTLAIFIGIYSYALMGLGLVGMLTWPAIWGVTIVAVCTGWNLLRLTSRTKFHPLIWLIIIQAAVNLVGALGPERGFDALWYHLPIPKMWLEAHRIFFIGGNLYYSAMPKLIDMLYIFPHAQLIHFGFGILTLVVIYKLARKYLDEKYSLLACVIFYSNLVVGWQSITAYIDLGRTFFEALAFYLLLDKKIYKSAIVLGLAMATKTLAVGSLGILGLLVLWGMRDWGKFGKFVLLVILTAAPWYIFSWASTGNPVYPIFSGYKLDWSWGFNLLRLADPINPIYVMILPVMWAVRKKIPVTVAAYCLLSFIVWYLTPRTGGGRFILPYLPVWSVAVAIAIKRLRDEEIKKFLVAMIMILAVVSIGYRAAANLIR